MIPLNRNVLVGTNNSYWRLLLSPGQVWSEVDDGDWSRASFPFILIHKQRNQTHNGIATFSKHFEHSYIVSHPFFLETNDT